MTKRLVAILALAAILVLGVVGVVQTNFGPSLMRGVTSVFVTDRPKADEPAAAGAVRHGHGDGTGSPGGGAAFHRQGADNGAAWGAVGWYGAVLALVATVTAWIARALRRFR
jgi:hypothetical protein